MTPQRASKSSPGAPLLALAMAFSLLSGAARAADLKKGDPCPSFQLVPLASTASAGIPLEKLLENGEPVLLSFFAAGCVPCLTEIPTLEYIAQTQNVDAYLISVDSAPADRVKSLALKHNFTLPVLLDPAGKRAGLPYGAVPGPQTTSPQLFLLSPDKTLWWRSQDSAAGLEKELTNQIRDLNEALARRVPAAPISLDSDSFLLVFTNSANGYLSPCGCADLPFGGVSRRSTFFKGLRKKFPDPSLLFLDAGDNYALRAPSLQSVMDVLDVLRYDAMVLGDQDILLSGKDARKTLFNRSRPFLAANFEVCDDAGCDAPLPHKIFKRGDLRVAVIAAMDPDIYTLAPKTWKKWVHLTDLRKKLQESLPSLRENNDVVILLSHSGLETDCSLAENIPGIDIVVGGHSQTALKDAIRVTNLNSGGHAFVVQAGPNGQYVGKVVVRMQPDKTVELTGYELVPLTDAIEDDAEVLKLLPQ
ncbi:MAG TPA: redoxin domain-containing protein [Elusimicrobiota bacterium]|nr:redoxin domain-containing protein [Elusimicrobiota bacterium]